MSKEKDNSLIVKGAVTAILAGVCVMWMYHTKGESGIGWFIFGLMVIWGF